MYISTAPQVLFQILLQFVIQTFIEHLAIHHYSAKLAPSYLCAI